MLVAAGFLDNLVLEADDRRILVKGRTSKDMVLVEDAPEKEVHREKLTTTVVALDLDDGRDRGHRRLARLTLRGPVHRNRRGLASFGERLRHIRKGEVETMQTTMTLEACCRCGQPIAPRRARHADRLGGHHRRAGRLLPVKAYHLKGRCYDEYRAAEAARREALKAA